MNINEKGNEDRINKPPEVWISAYCENRKKQLKLYNLKISGLLDYMVCLYSLTTHTSKIPGLCCCFIVVVWFCFLLPFNC